MSKEELKSTEMWQESVKLLYDEEECNGCALCVRSCPKDALELNPIGAAVRDNIEKPPLEFDPEKCVICGVCAALCPEQAFSILINGEEKLLIVENEGIPPEMEFKGSISVEQEKCPKGCNTCEELCREEAIAVGEEVEIDPDKCTYCGACALGCPSNAIELNRKELVFEGEETGIMKTLKEKLLGRVKLEDFEDEEG